MAPFFEDLKDAAADSLGDIVERGKSGLHLSRLRSQLRRLEKDKQEKYAELGEHVYRMIQSGALDSTPFIVERKALIAMDKQSDQLRAEIAEVEASDALEGGFLTRCTCGQTLTADARFCRGCGKNVEAIVESALAQEGQSQKPALLCTCGASLDQTAKFCAECGQPAASAAPRPDANVSDVRACPFCDGEIPTSAKFCRHCGKDTSETA
jgi:hypothetical protein